MFCTDDSHADDLLNEGHINKIVKKALAEEFSFTIRTNTGEKKVVPGDEMNIHILEEHRYAFDASDMTEIN